MDDYTRDDDTVTMMDFDLNLEPFEPPINSPLGVSWIDVESPRNSIEDRIRQLEAVSARARLRQRWRQSQNPLPQIINTVDNETPVMIFDRTKGLKRDSSHLVAKALELDTGFTKAVGDGEGFFDCNICLDTVKDPILTCCGHLFCWACFYRLPFVYSNAKECPVCKGEVTDSDVTPIYGNGNGAHEESESGGKVPPRPRANRVDSVRQKRVVHNHRMTQIPVADALNRLRMGINGPTRHRSRLIARALSEVDSSPSHSNVARVGADDDAAIRSVDETSLRIDFDMVLDNPVPAETTGVNNEARNSSGSRRRTREPRRRRRG